MVAVNPTEVAKLVQDELNRSFNHASRIRVLADQVRPEGQGTWWYVPVSYSEDPHNAYRYYEAFSCVEEHLEEKHNVNVLLVPRIIHAPDEER